MRNDNGHKKGELLGREISVAHNEGGELLDTYRPDWM